MSVMSSNVLLSLTNSPKLKDVPFTNMHDKENNQILTFNKVEPAHFWHFTF